jgi:hypothetical protein
VCPGCGTISIRRLMSELRRALQSLPQAKSKKHFVDIGGKQVEVSLEKKLEVIKNGAENYVITKFGIALRKPSKPKTRYSVLKKVDKGYSFEQGDIHWPNGTIDKGETWLIEYE